MSHSLRASTPAFTSLLPRNRPLRYLALAIAANGLLWGLAFLQVLAAPQVYTSQWTIIFLRGKVSTDIDIPNIGDAAAREDPPTFRKGEEVQTSYEAIAKTEAVRNAAAAKLGVSPSKIGKISSEMTEGTALMSFQVYGPSPEDAQKKAYAYHEALLERLNQLRRQQAAEQEAGFEQSLGVTRQRLTLAQQQLADYKAKSGLVDDAQIDQLSLNIETLRQQQAQLLAEQQETRTRLAILSQQLDVSPQQARDAFGLQVDPLLQQYLDNHSEATAGLSALTAKLGPNHPLVARAAKQQAATQAGLQARGQQLLAGQPVDDRALSHLNIGSKGTAREDLFRMLVNEDTDQQGLTAQTRELNRQRTNFDQRLTRLVQQNSTVEALNRNMQIAQAIFSSTLGGLDASKMDLFGSYPPIGLVAEPSLQQEPIRPQQATILTNAAIGSGVVTAALLILWLRKNSVTHWLLRYWGFTG